MYNIYTLVAGQWLLHNEEPIEPKPVKIKGVEVKNRKAVVLQAKTLAKPGCWKVRLWENCQ